MEKATQDNIIYLWENEYGEWEYQINVEGIKLGMRASEKDVPIENLIQSANESLNLIHFLGIKKFTEKNNDFSIKNFPEWKEFEDMKKRQYPIVRITKHLNQ